MLKKLKEQNQEAGFTLIELLVVILIIGILAAVAIPVFLNQRQKANDSAVISDLKNVATQMESNVSKTGTYPGSLPADAKFSNGVTVTVINTGLTTDEQAFAAKLGTTVTKPNGTRNYFNVAISGPFITGDQAEFYGPDSAAELKKLMQADLGASYSNTAYNNFLDMLNNGLAVEFYWDIAGNNHFSGKPIGSNVLGVKVPSRSLWTVSADKKFCLEGVHQNGTKKFYYDSSKGGITDACAT